MITIYNPACRTHAPPGFMVAGRLQPSPERPERVDMLLEGVKLVGSTIQAPPDVEEADLTIVHPQRYLDFLKRAFERWSRLPDASAYPLPNVYALGRRDLVEPHYPDSIVGQCGYHLTDAAAPILAETFAAAKASAATALYGARLLVEGQARLYALTRPPGHHATSESAGGFCYLNNSALAAEWLTRAGCRTAILDIDVHHGNGTEAIFYDRADVLTISIHADPTRFYPFFWGYAEAKGRGPGLGFNVNLPLPRASEDAAYLEALDLALTTIRRFAPDVLVLAAGLDIAAGDPFRGFAVSTGGFERIGKAIALLGLPILIIQEGGYPAEELAGNLAALLSGLSA
jgi:acetoin utilization deacetylase AcuC-like enzyme